MSNVGQLNNMILKFTFILLVLCLSTGCAVLSKECYLAASGDHIKRNRDDGALGELVVVQFGKGNIGIIDIDGYTVEICSSGRYGKELACGPVLPILPRFNSGFSWEKENHSIVIRNPSPNQNIFLKKVIVENFDEIPTESPYFTCYSDDQKFPINKEVAISIPANGCRKIFLPPNQSIKIIIQIGERLIPVNLIETTGVTWFYLWSV